jgi:hypothetical protein
MGRRSQERAGEAQETVPPVPLLAVVCCDVGGGGDDDDDAEGKEGPESEDEGEYGCSASLGRYTSY